MNNPNKKAGKSTRKMADKRRKSSLSFLIIAFNYCSYFIFDFHG